MPRKSMASGWKNCFPPGSMSNWPGAATRIEDAGEEALIEWAYARDLPLVATNPANYADPGFHPAHDAMLCIANSTHIDAAERPRSSAEAFVKSAPMMEEEFADPSRSHFQHAHHRPPLRLRTAPPQADPAEPCRRQGRRGTDDGGGCAGRSCRPARSLWRDVGGRAQGLRRPARIRDRRHQPHGLRRLLPDRRRLHQVGQGNGIPVGPGRGSGAGSVVAWALTITDLDPLRLGLLFERFLNPERVSMPDFDIDFCETRRGEVIRYVQRKCGNDHVAQIITFGKLKARAVLRDTGRILQMSYGHVDRLCKLVPNHPTDPWTLPRTLNGVSEFKREYDTNADVKRLIDLAMQLEGLPRNSSTHAAGVVIGDRPLAQLVPLYRDPRSDMAVTQFDMKYVEEAGLVKFDFLGLKTLSVLRKAVDLLARRGIAVDLDGLPWDDAEVYRGAPEGRHGRRVPAGIRRHAAYAGGGEANQFRRHYRARLALPAGPDGQHPAVRKAQERRSRDRISAPEAGGYPRRNLRHLRLPGTGDAGRAGAGRLFAGRCRFAAPRDGQEDPGRDGSRARASSKAARMCPASTRRRPTSCST